MLAASLFRQQPNREERLDWTISGGPFQPNYSTTIWICIDQTLSHLTCHRHIFFNLQLNFLLWHGEDLSDQWCFSNTHSWPSGNILYCLCPVCKLTPASLSSQWEMRPPQACLFLLSNFTAQINVALRIGMRSVVFSSTLWNAQVLKISISEWW